jgi:16S rRNA (uracil1498-N3)-methyltransferase
MARRRFFVPPIENGVARLEGDEAEHLTRVLRVERGQMFEISDNREVWLAEVTTARKVEVVFETREPIPVAPERGCFILVCALIKFDRLEWILEKATELGVHEIVLVKAERSEKGLEIAAHKRMGRWRRILVESAQQSRRARLPVISEPMTLTQALETAADWRYALDEEAADPLFAHLPDPAKGSRAALLLGPEGGWAERERAQFGSWRRVSLGPNILRAETAATAGLTLLTAPYHR